MEFTGTAVDGCAGRTPVGPTSTWTVDGEFTTPAPQRPPPPGPAPPPTTPAPPPVPHRVGPPPDSMGPATDGPHRRLSPFDPSHDVISDEAFHFAQEHGGRLIHGDDLDDAIEIERRALDRALPAPPHAVFDITNPDFGRSFELTRRARDRMQGWITGDPTPR